MDNNTPPPSPLPPAATPPPVTPTPAVTPQATVAGGEQKSGTSGLIIFLIILSFLFFAPLALILIWWKTSWPKGVKIAITVLVLLMMAGATFFFLMVSNELSKTPPSSLMEETTQPKATAAAVAPVSDVSDVSSWKTYTATKVNFRYPANMGVKETDKDQYSVVDSSDTEIISVDVTTLTADYPYQDLVDAMKEQITDVKEEKLASGVKLSGTLVDGADQTFYAIALLKGKVGVMTAATQAQDKTTFDQQLKILDLFIPTFKQN